MERYTATAYTNDHLTECSKGSDLWQLTAKLLLHLDECTSGSHGMIVDNSRGGTVVQRFCKRAIGD